MTTSSSSVPVLGPVLFFTSTDGYSYDVDNRPLFHLDTNIRHINTSLVGIGYGEHASLAGGYLTAGKAVLLASNGSVYYPTAAPSTNVTENILGLVIGVTDSGLNRVIWSSKHLDLDVLGLSNIPALVGASSGSYLVCGSGTSGLLYAKTTPNIHTEFVLGRIKSGPYIEINTASELVSNDVAATVDNAVKSNHSNMYGLTRFRNLLAFIDAGQAPLQYTKKTLRQSDYSLDPLLINPLCASLNTSASSIDYEDPTIVGTVYTSAMNNMVIKERYTQLAGGMTEVVSCNGQDSAWATVAYGTALPFNTVTTENYELQKLSSSGLDYNANVSLFKTFTVDKYYEYVKVASASPKIRCTATVFNPNNISDLGGEESRIIVWDFFEYDSLSGLEVYRHRIVLTGFAAEEALASATKIFPAALLTLS